MAPSVIEPATFRLVAQLFNQLHTPRTSLRTYFPFTYLFIFILGQPIFRERTVFFSKHSYLHLWWITGPVIFLIVTLVISLVTNSWNPESVTLEDDRQGRKLRMISLLLQWPHIHTHMCVCVVSFLSDETRWSLKNKKCFQRYLLMWKTWKWEMAQFGLTRGYLKMKLSEQNEGTRILLYGRSLLDPGRILLHFYKALYIWFWLPVAHLVVFSRSKG
jgi:hypothetical protein